MGSAHFISLRSRVPKTGVTTSYQTYDDGYYQRGVNTLTRTIDNGDGTFTDRATGLMWVKNVQAMITGATGVTSNNQIAVARGDWANITAYAVGDLAKDTGGSSYWVCLVAHTSIATVPDWLENHAYSVNNKVHDPTSATYWNCSVAHTSLNSAALSDYIAGHSYTAGDVIIHNSIYYQTDNTHTGASQPAEWATGQFYAFESYVSHGTDIYQVNTDSTSWGGPGSWNAFSFYSGGSIIVDPNDGHTIYQATGDFTTNGDINDDLNNGYWNTIGDTSDLFNVAYNYTGDNAYLNAVASDLFSFDALVNPTWANVGNYAFEADRALHPSYWSAIGDNYSFSADRGANPGRWRQTIWTASAANLTTPVGFTFATALTNINALSYAGYSDWRMPNAGEIQTIMNWVTALPHAVMTVPSGSSYWTSTPWQTIPSTFAIYMSFIFSYQTFSSGGKSSPLANLLVRSG